MITGKGNPVLPLLFCLPDFVISSIEDIDVETDSIVEEISGDNNCSNGVFLGVLPYHSETPETVGSPIPDSIVEICTYD